MTEEELEVFNEKRDRVRKKDQEAEAAAGKGAKGGKGGAPAKGKGAPAPPKGGAAQPHEEEHEAVRVEYPKADGHYNDEIHSFLVHFSSDRKTVIDAGGAAKQPRKRSDSEKASMRQDFEAAKAAETLAFSQIASAREQMKETRPQHREESFKGSEQARESYKTTLESSMEDRNKYREGIETRKAKEGALLDLVSQEKADVASLLAAIDAAVEQRVKEPHIERARRFLQLMEYVEEFEAHLRAAVAEKNKELLHGLLERLDSENSQLASPLPLDAKVLNEAKGALTKMK